MSGYLSRRKLIKTILLDLYNRDTPTDVDNIYDALTHASSVFPSDTNLTCTLTALATANTYSAWAEIQDGSSTKLSTSFADEQGHITTLLIETVSEANTVYMYQISYGDSKTVITTGRFAGGTKFQAPDNEQRLWAPEIPAGEAIYYRMKSATSSADTCEVHFRYHTHDA